MWRIEDHGRPRELRAHSSLALKSQRRDFADSDETFETSLFFFSCIHQSLLASLIHPPINTSLKFALYIVFIIFCMYVAALFCTMYTFF